MRLGRLSRSCRGRLLRRGRAAAEPGAKTASASSRPARPPLAPRTSSLVAARLAALFAVGFIVAYAEFCTRRGRPTQLLGLASAGAGLHRRGAHRRRQAAGRHRGARGGLPAEHPQEQEEIAQWSRESGSRITRKRLLIGAGAAAGGALGLAALTPGAVARPAAGTPRRWTRPVAARAAARRRRRRADACRGHQPADVLHGVPRGRRPEMIGPAARGRAPGPGEAAAARRACATGRRTGSSPTRRSAPTPGARSRCTASRCSRRSSPARRSCARATTRPSTRSRAGR